MAMNNEESFDLVSDDSSFYGDDDTKAELSKFCPNYTVKKRTQRFAKTRSKVDYDFKSKSSIIEQGRVVDRVNSASPGSQNVVRQVSRTGLQGVEASLLASDSHQEEISRDQYLGDPATLSPFETTEEFLRRLPVSDPGTANVGPWLWVHCRESPQLRDSPISQDDTGMLIARGLELLTTFDKRRSELENPNGYMAPSSIARALAPLRDQLEQDLVSQAVKCGMTTGKWMLFPNTTDLSRYWRLVAEATAAGRLGPTSKVSTYEPGKESTLICVYTHDFAETADLGRVLNVLVELGLCSVDGRPIYYKCDAYTYWEINSNNPYKLRASLYSSQDFLKPDSAHLRNGPVAKLNAREKRDL